MNWCSFGSQIRHRALQHGFTLIEVVIAMVIVAILATLAMSSYRQYIVRGNRAQAKQFLEDLANRQEQYMLDRRAYATQIGAGGLSMTPPQETNGLYTFAVALDKDCLGQAFTMPGYTLAATAIGSQASDGGLCLDSINQKTPADKWSR